MKRKPQYANSQVQMLGLVLHHALPLILLSVDYCFNAMPFVGRHVYSVMVICIVYLIFNYYVTKRRGTPVYSIMSWDDPVSFAIPICTVIIGLIIFKLLTVVN